MGDHLSVYHCGSAIPYANWASVPPAALGRSTSLTEKDLKEAKARSQQIAAQLTTPYFLLIPKAFFSSYENYIFHYIFFLYFPLIG